MGVEEKSVRSAGGHLVEDAARGGGIRSNPRFERETAREIAFRRWEFRGAFPSPIAIRSFERRRGILRLVRRKLGDLGGRQCAAIGAGAPRLPGKDVAALRIVSDAQRMLLSWRSSTARRRSRTPTSVPKMLATTPRFVRRASWASADWSEIFLARVEPRLRVRRLLAGHGDAHGERRDRRRRCQRSRASTALNPVAAIHPPNVRCSSGSRDLVGGRIQALMLHRQRKHRRLVPMIPRHGVAEIVGETRRPLRQPRRGRRAPSTPKATRRPTE